jgi:glycerophosphoryl diester phosphodiesterase
VNLLREGGRPLVIGHRGARAVAPENTRASLEAAVQAGADLVEFDVLPGLTLGHSPEELAAEPLDLDAALAFLGEHAIGVQLDLKLIGYEAEAVAAVRRHGLDDRALLSSAFAATTRTLRELAPDLPRALGYPRDRYGVSRFAWPAPVTRAGAAALRQAMPARIPLLLRRGRSNVLALHHTLCSGAAIAMAHRLDAAVLAWPVNRPEDVLRVAALGVDGIVSDDPGMTLATLTAP